MQEASMSNERASSNNLMMTFIIYAIIPYTENFKSHFADRFVLAYIPSFAALM